MENKSRGKLFTGFIYFDAVVEVFQKYLSAKILLNINSVT